MKGDKTIFPPLTLVFLLLAGFAGCQGPASEKLTAASQEAKERQVAFHCGLAEKFWIRDRMDLALRSLEMAVRQDPQAEAPRLKILDLHIFNKDAEGALEYYDSCPEPMQTRAPFQERRALIMAMVDQMEAAGEVWKDISRQGEGDTACRIAAAESRIWLGKCDEAFQILRGSLRDDPNDVELLSALADLCMLTDRFQEEAEYRAKILRMNPDSDSHLRAAARAFSRARRWKEGLEMLGQAVPSDPGSPHGTWEAAIAWLHYGLGEFEKAGSCFDRALSRNGFVPDGDEVLACSEIRMRNRDFDGATELLEPWIEKRPDDGLARAALAWAYHCKGLDGRSIETAEADVPPTRGRDILQSVLDRLREEEDANP